ncbi:hypothetical protein ACJX0J_035528 [Zea mays]
MYFLLSTFLHFLFCLNYVCFLNNITECIYKRKIRDVNGHNSMIDSVIGSLPFMILRPNSTDYTIYPFPYSNIHTNNMIDATAAERNEPVQMKVILVLQIVIPQIVLNYAYLLEPFYFCVLFSANIAPKNLAGPNRLVSTL